MKKSIELAQSWQKILQKHEAYPSFAGKYSCNKPSKPMVTKIEIHRTSRDAESFSTPGGFAALKPSPKYTGHAMMGIATMHKSNAVPVFSIDEAHDLAKMRR